VAGAGGVLLLGGRVDPGVAVLLDHPDLPQLLDGLVVVTGAVDHGDSCLD
jgi:hypothetical protein